VAKEDCTRGLNTKKAVESKKQDKTRKVNGDGGGTWRVKSRKGEWKGVLLDRACVG